jgi:hypothetical protein
MKKKSLLLTAMAIFGLVTLTSAQVPSYVPTNGLVGWWPFNGNANDESGNGNNGAVLGATLSPDRFGTLNKAYSFDGINDRVKIPFSLSFNTDTGSVSLWMNSAQLPSLNDPQDCLFGKGWGYPQLVFRNDSKAYIQIANSTSSFPSVGTQSNISLNVWKHILAVYEGASLKIYIDGVLNNSQILSPMPNYYSFCNSEFWIGGFRHQNSCMPNDSVQFFHGKIDDIGFWNRALSQQEITDLYNGNICYQTITVTDTLLINMGITGFNPVTYNNTIRIFPNPANDHITIDYGNFASLSGYQLIIENSLGQQVFQTSINQQSNYLSLSNWGGNGLYFVRIIDPLGNTIDIRKIVLQ